MKWLQDSYICTAGDAAAGFTGRGYNPRTGKWETLSALNLSTSGQSRMRIRSYTTFLLVAGTFGLKEGVIVAHYTVLDPQRTDFIARLMGGNELQGAGQIVSWMGDYPMSCGCLSRINVGGVATGDRIDTLVGYEDDGR